MLERKIKEIYNVDTISQDKGWKKIVAALENVKEDTLIDFGGVNVVDPWQCPEFKNLLKLPHIHIKFTNNLAVVKKIKMMCIIEGLNPDKVINEEIEKPKVETMEEKKIKKIGDSLIPLFIKNEEGTWVFEVKKKYDNLNNTSTLSYIKYAIEKINERDHDNRFMIKLGTLLPLSNVLEVLARIRIELKTAGIELDIDTDNEETLKNLNLAIYMVGDHKLSASDRYNLMVNSVKPNTAGLLIKYRKSKALDEYGRHGKGEVISCRIAVFRGFTTKQNNKIPKAIIESYNDNYFYTRSHWMIEHDNDQLDKLHSDMLEISMPELGFCDSFLGSQYHFLRPVQQNKSDTRTIISGIDENGKNIKQVCTIPERIKTIFDDWEVLYNKEELEQDIEKTKEVLSKQNESK